MIEIPKVVKAYQKHQMKEELEKAKKEAENEIGRASCRERV